MTTPAKFPAVAPGVYLVGAGPGPLELLTLKALLLIQAADVLVHDQLVGADVLAAARPDAKRIFVGKRGGQACKPQDEIDRLLVELGRAGGVVVRLKGGDPLVFGRGGEEAAELRAAGIKYEIVPGVTAALAAGAYAGIPLTHRAHSSAVVFLTGHEDPAKEAGAGLDWAKYAQLDATLCIYMGVRNLAPILSRLLAAGLPPDTPAALIESAAAENQRTLVATAATLADRAKAEAFKAPALAIVGAVAALSSDLRWFKSRA